MQKLETKSQTTSPISGLVVAVAVAVAAMLLARVLPLASPALTTVFAGMIAANAGCLPESFRPGLAVAAKRVLRIGIVLLGFQLAVGDVLALGAGVAGVVVAVVAGGIGVGLLVGKMLRLPQAETILISCGFSICGAAAVAAAGGALDSDQDDDARLESQMAIALALVVVFGSAMIGIVPLLATTLGLGEFASGIVAGGSIHEVAQVVAAGSILGGGVLSVAVLVKLGRVVLLAPTIAVITAVRRRDRTESASGTRPPILPLWVVGFLAAIALRSLGIVPAPVLDVIKPLQVILLAAAMFALGAGARFALIKDVGLRPIILAVTVTLTVLGISLMGAYIVS